ncbi:hypothetical protein BDN71DRAFT_1457428 [Pleurotus eryngii]|uniref:Uncharacterized protein n=1 Tax=Pleurotus eryngii TaxID=5323 RepID=A0A9P5ZMC6_PLEER|nr:hypothetical protein BDN71DRAFT_1457428 [Pleurotus eryngii]
MDPLLFAPVPSICAFVAEWASTPTLARSPSLICSNQRTSKPPADPIPSPAANEERGAGVCARICAGACACGVAVSAAPIPRLRFVRLLHFASFCVSFSVFVFRLSFASLPPVLSFCAGARILLLSSLDALTWWTCDCGHRAGIKG